MVLTDKAEKRRAKMLAWVAKQGRVTVADLAFRSHQPVRTAFKRLAEAEERGELVRTGGGPGEAFYWSVKA